MEFLKKVAARNQDYRGSRPPMLAVIGDSVTHGCFEVFVNREGHVDTRIEPSAGYVAQLGKRLEQLFPGSPVTLINAGISGDNAPGGQKRLARDVLAAKPDLVIVNFALNDCCSPEGKAGAKPYGDAIRAMLAEILSSGAEAMLLTPNHMCSYVDPALPAGILRDIAADVVPKQTEGMLCYYVNTARQIAREMNVPIADAFETWESLAAAGVDTTAMLVNHINHPTSAAHAIFVDAIMNTLLQRA